MDPTTIIQCPGSCTVVIEHRINWAEAISSPLTSEQIADYMALWGLFLVAAVVVLAAKSIYNRFRVDTHEG